MMLYNQLNWTARKWCYANNENYLKIKKKYWYLLIIQLPVFNIKLHPLIMEYIFWIIHVINSLY